MLVLIKIKINIIDMTDLDRITQNPKITQALQYAAWLTEKREAILAL